MIENKGSVIRNNCSGMFPFKRHLYPIMVYGKYIEIWNLCGICYVGLCHTYRDLCEVNEVK